MNLAATAAERHSRSIGREGHGVVVSLLADSAESLPGSIKPGELGSGTADPGPAGPVGQNARSRNRKLRNTSIVQFVGDRHCPARQLQPLSVESLGHERALPHKENISHT